MKLGERIRFLRESVGVTQTALADASGTTKQNIYKDGSIARIPGLCAIGATPCVTD